MDERRKFVTIFADASHLNKFKAGGWGCWIKADGPAITEGGPFKDRVHDAYAAECQALANALVVAHRNKVLRPGVIVMLQSDCVGALMAVRRAVPRATDAPVKGGATIGVKIKRLEPRVRPAMDLIAKVLDAYGVDVRVRHVKGHTEGNGRHYVNRVCDELAGRGMKRAVEAIA